MMEGLRSEFEQIRRNFCHFEIFGLKNRFFSYTGSTSICSLLFGTLAEGNICIFGFFMVIYACSSISEAFHQVIDDQKAEKHHENHLAATFCTSRKYFWENEVLEGQMSSKLRNSTWIGYPTSRAFQRAIMSSIWMPESTSKSGRKACDPLKFLAEFSTSSSEFRPVGTSFACG